MTELEQNASVQRAAALMGMTAAHIAGLLREMAEALQRHQDGIEAASLATYVAARGREAQRSPYDIGRSR